MNTIAIRMLENHPRHPQGGLTPPHVFLDGRDMLDLVTELTGGLYQYNSDAYWRESYLPTDDDGNPVDSGTICLFVCICGWKTCSSFGFTINVLPSVVRWDGFGNSRHLYDSFGPFAFDRRQYEAAIAVLANLDE